MTNAAYIQKSFQKRIFKTHTIGNFTHITFVLQVEDKLMEFLKDTIETEYKTGTFKILDIIMKNKLATNQLTCSNLNCT